MADAEHALLETAPAVSESGDAAEAPEAPLDGQAHCEGRNLRPPRSSLFTYRSIAVTAACLLSAAALLSVGLAPRVKPAGAEATEKVLGAIPQKLYDVAKGPGTPEQVSHDLDYLTPVAQSSIAICTIDAWQSIGNLGQMGIAADMLSKVCKRHILHSQIKDVSCSATATYLITQIAMVATLFSDMATKCSLTANPAARCSTDISGLTSLLSAVATHGQNIWLNCESHFPRPRRMCDVPELSATKEFDTGRFNRSDVLLREICSLEDPPSDSMGRRLGALQPGHFIPNLGKPNPAKQAGCAFSIVEVTSMLSRIGININAATHTCTNGDHTQCAVSVTGILAVMGMAGQYMSAAIAACPTMTTYIKAPCSAAVNGMVGALAGAASFATDMTQGCPH